MMANDIFLCKSVQKNVYSAAEFISMVPKIIDSDRKYFFDKTLGKLLQSVILANASNAVNIADKIDRLSFLLKQDGCDANAKDIETGHTALLAALQWFKWTFSEGEKQKDTSTEKLEKYLTFIIKTLMKEGLLNVNDTYKSNLRRFPKIITFKHGSEKHEVELLHHPVEKDESVSLSPPSCESAHIYYDGIRMSHIPDSDIIITGKTALMFASYHGLEFGISYLLAVGADETMLDVRFINVYSI